MSNNSAASTISKEYLEAVSVMNEDTMNRACHLLLKPYESDDTNAEASNSTQSPKIKTVDVSSKNNTESTKSVPDQLLEMYYKCQESLTVIRKQQTLPPGINLKGTSQSHYSKMLPPGVPSLNGMKKRTVMTSKHGIHPSHKTSSSAIGLAMAMKRKASLNNLKLGVTVNKATGMSAAVHGKAMLGHRGGLSISPTTQPAIRSSGDDSSSAAPPPAALSFLAKLNRDPNEAEDTKRARKSREEDSMEESERSKKRKKKKTKGKQKHSDEDESSVAKEKSEETDDSDKKEGRKRKRRRPSNSSGDDNDKNSESLSKQGKASKKKRDRNEEEEEDAPSSIEEDDNDDGDTSADETYRGSVETSATRRTSISRKAKPDAETLTGGSPPSKRRKTRNQSTEAASENSDDPSPSRRRNPRRGAP